MLVLVVGVRMVDEWNHAQKRSLSLSQNGLNQKMIGGIAFIG